MYNVKLWVHVCVLFVFHDCNWYTFGKNVYLGISIIYIYTGWPIKKWKGILPTLCGCTITGMHYNWYQRMRPLLRKMTTKISNFGWFSSLFSRAHFVRQRRGPKCRCEWMPFQLATVVNSIPFNFINGHCNKWVSSV